MSSTALPIPQHSETPLLLFSDYHMHPQGHRAQRYTQELLQPWADSARRLGLTDIAFTDHDRYHAGVDFDEINRLRERNPDLQIRAGIELDNDPVHSPAGRKWIEKNWDKLDVVLGSMYAEYFRRLRELIGTGLIDCLAHLDLIKIHGHRPRTDIGTLVNETLEFIQSRTLAIELSTAGWRKPVNELYPSDSIIELAMEKGIPFTIASDAHSHAQLADNYARLAQKLGAFGVRQLCIFDKHQRIVRVVCAESLL